MNAEQRLIQSVKDAGKVLDNVPEQCKASLLNYMGDVKDQAFDVVSAMNLDKNSPWFENLDEIIEHDLAMADNAEIYAYTYDELKEIVDLLLRKAGTTMRENVEDLHNCVADSDIEDYIDGVLPSYEEIISDYETSKAIGE